MSREYLSGTHTAQYIYYSTMYQQDGLAIIVAVTTITVSSLGAIIKLRPASSLLISVSLSDLSLTFLPYIPCVNVRLGSKVILSIKVCSVVLATS